MTLSMFQVLLSWHHFVLVSPVMGVIVRAAMMLLLVMSGRLLRLGRLRSLFGFGRCGW
jgi:hypothetical protein